MKRALLLAVALAVTARGGSRKPTVIDGKLVKPGPAFAATPLIEVRDLKFYQCKVLPRGLPCTVITGAVVSHLDHPRFVVSVEIDMYEIVSGDTYPGGRGTAKIVIDRPRPGVPERFRVRAPDWLAYHGPKAKVPRYVVRTSFVNHRPTLPPRVAPKP